MVTKDKTAKKTELIIDALMYAETHNLDINDKSSVKRILKKLDPDHSSDKEVEEIMELLKHADKFMTMRANRKSKQQKLPN